MQNILKIIVIFINLFLSNIGKNLFIKNDFTSEKYQKGLCDNPALANHPVFFHEFPSIKLQYFILYSLIALYIPVKNQLKFLLYIEKDIIKINKIIMHKKHIILTDQINS